uniref:Ankyrin repeat and ubiquitin domain containing 1 n=2 Tax=Crocodylus porosus TaxID=8502 RepID=A0A7M4EID1_CROPO
MRIFIAFEGLCESFDILAEQTVQTVKQMIKDYFHVPLSEDKQGRRYLELIYAGAVLKDNWIIDDIGISVSSIIRCVVKEEDKPAFYVYNGVSQEKVPIMGSIYLLATKVSFLKSLVTLKCGFPNSVYCLRTPGGREMYDCNTLNDYHLDIGTTLFLDVWDGWKEFLIGCLLGNNHTVQRHLSREEPVLNYQKRVALYMAAHFGHLGLATWILQQGVRPNEAVGVHPYRAWCQETENPDINKCPVHAAAEAGQLMVLKAFVNCTVLCLECQSPTGQIPLNICIKHKHKDCVLYLVTKIWSVVSYPNFSLPMKIYIKLKQWLLQAQSHILSKKRLNQGTVFRTRVGDIITVDGFTKPKMTSKSPVKKTANKVYRLPNLSDHIQHERESYPLTSTKNNLQLTKLKLPPLENVNKLSNIHRLQQKKKKREKVAQPTKDETMDQHTCLAKVPLPPVSKLQNSWPPFFYSTPHAKLLLNSSLESFSEYSGRTPRENAIYYLAVASAFKEKPWLQQLEIARTLAKKSIFKPVN